MDGVNYSSIPGPRIANRALQWARGEVMVMDQLLPGQYSTGFVWCAELSQKTAGHRSWFHWAVPVSHQLGIPGGSALQSKDSSVSSSWLRWAPKGCCWLLSASPAQEVTPDSAAADKQCLGRSILALEEKKGPFWVGEFNLCYHRKLYQIILLRNLSHLTLEQALPFSRGDLT